MPPDPSPIEFLQLVADPLRWQLLQELARSDRRVERAHRAVRQAPEPGLVPPAGAARRRGWCRPDGARPTGATPTTASTSPGAGACCARPALPCTRAAARARSPRAPPVPRGGRRGCCSCAPATAPAPRSPRRCSRRCRTTPSRPAAPGAIRRCSTPTRSASWPSAASTSRADRPSTSVASPAMRFDHVITLCDRVREVCPEFPTPPGARPLEHPRPGPRGRLGRRDLSRVRADRRGARVPHRVPPAAAHRTRQHKRRQLMPDETVNVRYMVDDVAAAIDFYTSHLGFTVQLSSPAFADVRRGQLRLLLSGPQSSAGRPMPDGAQPGSRRVEPDPPHRRRPRTLRSIGCAARASRSATTSSPAPAAPRSSSRIRRAT